MWMVIPCQMVIVNKPLANPSIVLREEFDDSAILFDPDSGDTFGLNPTGVFIWKRLDGRHGIENILREVRETHKNLPEEVEKQLKDFIQDLADRGFAILNSGRGQWA